MSDHQFHERMNSKYTLNDLLKGKDLEIIAASLLLLGKLRVESVQLFRNSSKISVVLLGDYRRANNEKANNMADFLESNGDMTMDEVFEAISKRMNKKRM